MATAPDPAKVQREAEPDLLGAEHHADQPRCDRSSLGSQAATAQLDALYEFLDAEQGEAHELGNKHQGLPVRFRNLTVYGKGTSEVLATTLPIALYRGVTAPIWYAADLVQLALDAVSKRGRDEKTYQREKHIVSDLTGVVQQGETLLVLGRPGSGVTTLLRVLAMDREGFSHISGHLDYGSLSAKAIPSSLRPEFCFMPENDSHFATVSVMHTLELAALNRAPRRRITTMSRKEWATTRVKHWTTALGLASTHNTVVGNELVRGISGGERKRVSALEAVLSRPSVLCIDNATAGLDSSSALTLVRALAVWGKLGKRSVIAGLRQVGESVYSCFDKVMVLVDGQCAYFGPSSEASAYFESLGFKRLPGQTTADFVCACTDPLARNIESDTQLVPPRRATEFASAFKSSRFAREMISELQEYETKYPSTGAATHVIRASKAEKARSLPSSSKWTSSIPQQISSLVKRQYALIASDWRPYVTKTVVNVSLSIVIGTLFRSLPSTSEAAFARGSVLLLSILFNGYLQLSELGATLANRPVVKRHGNYGLYGASWLALSRVVSDIPLILAQVLLFAGMTYGLAGLQRSWERFGIYLLFVYSTALNLTTVFRMFAAFSPSFDEAMRYCGIALNIFVVYAGYFIPTPSMRPSLRWLRYYVDPISYAYEAVLSNEFRNLTLQCSPNDIVPRGSTYNDSRYQTCSILGSIPGQLNVSGELYLSTSYEFSYDNIWRNLAIIVILAIIFLVVGVTATNWLTFAPAGRVTVFQRVRKTKLRVKSRRSGLDEEVGPSGIHRQSARDGKDNLNGLLGDAASITWKDLNLWVKTSEGEKQLLHRMTGYVRPGELTALMGPSGAGKTTLLNALAGMGGRPVLRGDVWANGVQPNSNFYQSVGFVEQLDLHDQQSTVREALTFSACLRQPQSISEAQRLADVDRILDIVGLADLEDALVGTVSAGLGLEDRKRLTIGVELCARPSVLFVDEAVSGMDTASAVHIIQLLQKLAKSGLAVISTVHQPSSEIFDYFDNVLLLEREGKQVYFGPGKNAVPYLEARTGALCDQTANPAEFLIDTISLALGVILPPSTPANQLGFHGLAIRWQQSRERLQVLSTIEEINQNAKTSGTSHFGGDRNTSLLTQCKLLTTRLSKHFWRDSSFSYTKILTSTIVSLIVGCSFWREPLSVTGMQNRMFSVFLILFIPPVFMNQLIVKWFTMKGLYDGKEKPAGMYSSFALCTSYILAELPYCIICGIIFWTVWYFGVGFPLDIQRMGFSFMMIELFFIFQSCWAIWIAALAPTLGTVANLLPFFLVSMEAFNGSLLPYKQMPAYWKWMYWVSPFQWYVRAMLSSILHSLPIRCKRSETVTFLAPPNQTCYPYASQFLAEHAGYLISETANSRSCEYCKYTTGDDFLSNLSITHTFKWQAAAVFATYTVGNIILAYFFVCGGRQFLVRQAKRLFEKVTMKQSSSTST